VSDLQWSDGWSDGDRVEAEKTMAKYDGVLRRKVWKDVKRRIKSAGCLHFFLMFSRSTSESSSWSSSVRMELCLSSSLTGSVWNQLRNGVGMLMLLVCWWEGTVGVALVYKVRRVSSDVLAEGEGGIRFNNSG